ncbi:MAG TPA: bifunctional GNAT family N-acetyltransferase/carbon-nitrogen hydrolase family protein [Chitinophagaceae bacterium]|jgi:predicted amidohydrolase/GNAT superfamily N-acetyltransferase|nr:bifunctional GNAT family N-acetyltransferase/carbon-nitrogen hydrolase family protein [Chitinophagaceae bacterium]
METSIEVRNLTIDDYNTLKESMIQAYASLGGQYWKEEALKRLINKFPDGQIVITHNGKVVGCALSIIVKYEQFGDNHTYRDITGNFSFETHNPKGDTLYGIEVFVHPDFRGLRLARRLYDARKVLCERLNLKAIIAGGRIPSYSKYAGELTPREYIEKVKAREIHDPTLSFQLSNEFQVKKVIRNYLPEDNESMGYATLLIWHNVFYEAEKNILLRKKDVIRIGLVQWQMRPYHRMEDLLQHVEYFIDAVSDYQSDFILFPELFNAPLMGRFNNLHSQEAIRELAAYTKPLVEEMARMAISYNVNVITGSMPEIKDGELYNTAYILQRNGKIDFYDKIHITPAEEDEWNIKGGDSLKVVETDAGKIGVLVCYDVEFPELARKLADEGMEILFVPFLTDTQNAYNRVRFCAQARAVENECFVAIAGSVGNLPKVNNMDLQFAQSAVFTPSDFAFPVNGIKAEATPNTEMIVISDVDLSLLTELHNHGSVQTLKDRRTDLYRIIFNEPSAKTLHPATAPLAENTRF